MDGTIEGRTTRASKRRRISPPQPSPPRRSGSPDELGDYSPATQPVVSRQASTPTVALHGGSTTEPRALSYSPLSAFDSPDELDHTIHQQQPQPQQQHQPQQTQNQQERQPSPAFFQERKPPPVPVLLSASSFRGSFSEAARQFRHNHARALEDNEDGVGLLRPPATPQTPEFSRLSTPIGTSPAPDGKGTREKEARFVRYQVKTVLRGHKRGVAGVRFSPDGRLIASCSADATIRIWDAGNGKHLQTLEGHLAGVSTIAWAPDSKTIASGSDDKTIRLWDVSTGKQHPYPLIGHHHYIYTIAFSPKGNILVSGSYDEAVILWDIRTRHILRTLPAHSDPVGGVDFIRDGTLIVSCAGDGLIRIWDTQTGQCLRTLVHEDNAPVTAVRFAPNGRFVLAWTLDSSVRLWDYVEGRCVKTYQGHANERFSLSGAFGVYGGNEDDGAANGTIARTTTTTAATTTTREKEKQKKAFVVGGSDDGRMFWWDVISKEVLQSVPAHEGVVLSVDTRAEGGLIVSCGVDKTVRIWEKMVEGEEPEEEDAEEQDKKDGGAEEAQVANGHGDGVKMEDVEGDVVANGRSHSPAEAMVNGGGGGGHLERVNGYMDLQ